MFCMQEAKQREIEMPANKTLTLAAKHEKINFALKKCRCMKHWQNIRISKSVQNSKTYAIQNVHLLITQFSMFYMLSKCVLLSVFVF